jgi:hypothetical protein
MEGRYRLPFFVTPDLIRGDARGRSLPMRQKAGSRVKPGMTKWSKAKTAPHPKAGICPSQKKPLSYIIRLCQPSSGAFIRRIKAVASRLAGAATAGHAARIQGVGEANRAMHGAELS